MQGIFWLRMVKGHPMGVFITRVNRKECVHMIKEKGEQRSEER